MSSEAEQAQINEVEALQSIFGPDFAFVQDDKKAAWSRVSLRTFRIRIDAMQYDDSMDARRDERPHLCLRVRLPFTYPRTAPELDLVDIVGISAQEVSDLKLKLLEDVRQMLGSEMIYDLVENIRAFIHMRSRSIQKASLNEERLAKLAKERTEEAEALQKHEAAQLTKRIQLKTELSFEVAAARDRSGGTQTVELLSSPSLRTVEFATAVVLNGRHSLGSFSVSPLKSSDSSACRVYEVILDTTIPLIMKEFCFSNCTEPGMLEDIQHAVSHKASKELQGRSDVFSGANLAYQTALQDRSVLVQVLQTRAEHGSLQNLLDCIGTISPHQARHWLLDLAEQLSVAHRRGLFHGRIQPAKVLLSSHQGRVSAFLVDYNYGQLVHLVADHGPSALRDSTSRINRQDDIAELGLLAIAMFYGQQFNDVNEARDYLLSMHDNNLDVRQYILSMIDKEARARPTATDLVGSTFLRYADKGNGVLGNALSASYRNFSRYTEDFEEVAEIGRGGFGTVVKARNRLDGRLYAVKKIQSENESRVLREVSGLARLNHPGVVRYFGAWQEDVQSMHSTTPNASPGSSALFAVQNISYESSGVEFGFNSEETSQTTSKIVRSTAENSMQVSSTPSIPRLLFIQMEFCGGSTLRQLIDQGKIGKNYWQYFAQLVSSVKYIHAEGLIHRDLKPANIFVDNEGQLKLGDFGLAAEGVTESSRPTQSDALQEMTAEIGTFFYSAPEIMEAHPKYADKVDIYALGIIFVELLCDWPTAMGRINAIRGIRHPEIKLPESLLVHTRLREKALVLALLSHDPKQRPTASELSNLLPAVRPAQFTENTFKLLEQDAVFKQALVTKLFSMHDPMAEMMFFDPARLLPDRSHREVRELHLQHFLQGIFEALGASPRVASIIEPSLSNGTQPIPDQFELLSRSGTALVLVQDLHSSYARDLARAEQTSAFSKTFAFNRVYSKGKVEPVSSLQATFDVVDPEASDDRFVVVRTALEISRRTNLLTTHQVRIELGHSYIMHHILGVLRVPIEKWTVVQHILRNLSIQRPARAYQIWKDQLLVHINEASIRQLYILAEELTRHPSSKLQSSLQTVREQFPTIELDLARQELRQFEAGCGLFEVGLPLAYNLFMSETAKYGLCFSIVTEDSEKRSEAVAIGGDFRNTIIQLAVANDFVPKIAFGILFDVSRIADLCAESISSSSIEVVINSYAHENQARALLIALWDAELAAITCRDSDSSLAYARTNRTRFVLSFKDKKGQKQIVRVRNMLDKDTVVELDAADVVQHLRGIIKQTSSTSSTQQSGSTFVEPTIIVVGADERKNKRQMLSTKALQQYRDLINHLQAGQLPILICDLDGEQMGFLKAAINGERAALSMLSQTQAAAFKSEVSKLRYEDIKQAVAYSFRSTELVLLDL